MAPAGRPATTKARGQVRPARAEVRARLIDAAVQQFEERGYAETSVSSVSEAAGFTRGAAYSNFTSKEDLFLAALESNAGRRIDDIVDAVPLGVPGRRAGARDHRTRLRAQVGSNATWAALFMEFVLQARHRPELADRLQQTRTRMRDRLAQRLAEKLGLATADEARPLATAAMALHNGLFIEAMCDPSAMDLGLPLLQRLVDGQGL